MHSEWKLQMLRNALGVEIANVAKFAPSALRNSSLSFDLRSIWQYNRCIMNEQDKIQLFESTPIPSAVAKLGIPTVITSLVMVLYNMADTFFVGTINDPIQSAAVTIAAPVLLAFNAVVNLFGVGCSSLMSRALGKKDYIKVKKVSSYGFYCAIALSLLFSICCTVFRPGLLKILGADDTTFEATASYMFWTVSLGAAPSILNLIVGNMIRSEGESLHASVGTMSGCILNIILDPIFIMPWGLNMGASGAGLATLISNCVACLYFAIFMLRKRGQLFMSFHPKYFCLEKDIVKDVGAIGIPAAIQNLLNVSGMAVLNNFSAAYGTDAVAAMGIVHKINMVPMYFSMGLGQGVMPLIGYNHSSGNRKRMKDSIIFTAKIAVAFIVCATALYYIFAPQIVRFFMNNDAIVAYGGKLLRGFCLGLPFLAIDFLAISIFQAVGMGKESFLFAVMRKVVLEIPALYILNKLYPYYGMGYSQLVAEFVLAVIAVLVLKKLFKED